MLLNVCVPDGLLSGDTFTCEAEGQSFDISVPEGCCGGQVLEVDLPVVQETLSTPAVSPGMTLVEIIVPDECYSGMEFAVQWGENEFTLNVPEGCEPGQLISVELPVLEDPPVGMPRSRRSSAYNAEAQQAFEEQAALQQEQEALEQQRALEQLQQLAVTPAQAQLDVRGGRIALPSGGKYFTGQVLEVMRSDGSWSNAKIVDWESGGDTYTVTLEESGMTKYFVESDELRTRREGTFLRGALVEVVTGELGECYPGGRIDEYDDESGTFTVRRFDTGGLGRLYYVAADEVRGISYF